MHDLLGPPVTSPFRIEEGSCSGEPSHTGAPARIASVASTPWEGSGVGFFAREDLSNIAQHEDGATIPVRDDGDLNTQSPLELQELAGGPSPEQRFLHS